MLQKEIEKIASDANIIVAGYAFTNTNDNQIRILDLENPNQAAVLNKDSKIYKEESCYNV